MPKRTEDEDRELFEAHYRRSWSYDTDSLRRNSDWSVTNGRVYFWSHANDAYDFWRAGIESLKSPVE